MPHSIALAPVIAQSASGGGDPGSLLIGVAAILAALVPLVIAQLARHRRSDEPEPEPEPDGLYADARRRIDLLVETVKDLEVQLRDCRTERARLTRELAECAARERLTVMEIGDLEHRLADARAALEKAISDLSTARAELIAARQELAHRNA